MRWNLIVILTGTGLLAGVTPMAQDLSSDEFIWDSGPYTPESVATIRAEANLIEVPVLVRDRGERPVPGLQKEDFLLFDNGKPQTISSFQVLTAPGASTVTATAVPGSGANVAAAPPEPVQPRYVALFFDDVNTKFSDPQYGQDANADFIFGQDAAIKLIEDGLDPGEQVGIFTASRRFTLGFTGDTKVLLNAISKLRTYPRMSDQHPNACPMLDTYQAWAILNLPPHTFDWDKAYNESVKCWGRQAAEGMMNSEAHQKMGIAEAWTLETLGSLNYAIRRLGDMPGRRILLLASQGFVTLSFRYRQKSIIEAASRAKVVINSLSTAGLIVADGLHHYGLGDPLNDSLASLAYDTGGQFFYNNNDLATAFHKLSAPPAVSYILGFSPLNLKSDGSRHTLKVKLAEPAQHSIEARPDYYAPGGELSPPEKKAKRLDRAVTSRDTLSEIPIELTATPAPGAVKISVHTDVRKLPFRHLSGRHVERLLFVTALFDANNQFLSGVEGIMQLQLKDGSVQTMSDHGLDTHLSIQAPAGKYRVRQVVQEIEGGHLASVDRSIEIH